MSRKTSVTHFFTVAPFPQNHLPNCFFLNKKKIRLKALLSNKNFSIISSFICHTLPGKVWEKKKKHKNSCMCVTCVVYILCLQRFVCNYRRLMMCRETNSKKMSSQRHWRLLASVFWDRKYYCTRVFPNCFHTLPLWTNPRKASERNSALSFVFF